MSRIKNTTMHALVGALLTLTAVPTLSHSLPSRVSKVKGKAGANKAKKPKSVAASRRRKPKTAIRAKMSHPKTAVVERRSDTLAGYVTSFNPKTKAFAIRLNTGESVRITLTDATYPEIMRNLGEGFQSAGEDWSKILRKGQYVFVEGISYTSKTGLRKGRRKLEAKHIRLTGADSNKPRFEEPTWWVNQVRSVADFYLKAQFPTGKIDFRNYRTHLKADGEQLGTQRQEAATLSRLVYGFSTAYLLTGEQKYFEAAQKGTAYLRDKMREHDPKTGVTFWNHALDIDGAKSKKVVTSQFGDDKGAIAAYEQIYALAGPVQTYRITGDPKILKDTEGTMKLFEKYFLDKKQGGYFSHVDPKHFNPRAESLGENRARKNWNSVGDHAPAYLINLLLATGDPRHKKMLVDLSDIIEHRFQDYKNSPFVQERFHEDWRPDRSWGWQQDRAVVGHNLKIAWNLTRVNNIKGNVKYTKLAKKIGNLMPRVGMDAQRGGWYDVMERKAAKQDDHRLTWHDRKPWWQQEQAILAYQVMGGTFSNAKFKRLGRESAAFYNANFADHDVGGIHFNVGANGQSYRSGTEFLKGSHSMSGYHSIELGYLSAVYTNLLNNKQPLDLHFRPQIGGFKDNLLRVSPDLLPAGRVRIGKVWLDGKEYKNFDAKGLTVTLPDAKPAKSGLFPAWRGNKTSSVKTDYKVKVQLVPVD